MQIIFPEDIPVFKNPSPYLSKKSDRRYSKLCRIFGETPKKSKTKRKKHLIKLMRRYTTRYQVYLDLYRDYSEKVKAIRKTLVDILPKNCNNSR